MSDDGFKTLDVKIGKILYHKPGQFNDAGVPFLIANTDQGIIKGEMASPLENESYRLYGDYAIDKTRGTPYFAFDTFQIFIEDNSEGIIDYLCKYVKKGLGKVRARQVVERFGRDTIQILRSDPDRIREIPGTTEETVKSVVDHFSKDAGITPESYASVQSLIGEYKPGRRIVSQIAKDFGASASQVIRDNPYRLMAYPGLGWKTVDTMAIQKVGYSRSGLDRFKAAVMESLDRINTDGDTYVTRDVLAARVYDLCGSAAKFDEAISSLLGDKNPPIVEFEYNKTKAIAKRSVYESELKISNLLNNINVAADHGSITLDREGMEGEQIQAIEFIETHPVSILAGAPGVGKTFTVTNVIKSLNGRGYEMLVFTPTGKAAKRADEVLKKWLPNSKVQVSTIHRALGSIPSDDDTDVPESSARFGRGRKFLGFRHNEENRLYVDAAFGDEWSMVDVNLFRSLLEALPPGCRLLMVGDPNQLPSVGAGSVLRDMIAGGIPTFHLTTPRRNSGLIVEACNDIKAGKTPRPAGGLDDLDPANGKNWVHIEVSDPDQIAARIVELHGFARSFDPLWDFQVISPQNGKLPIACANLNSLLSHHFNGERHSEKISGDESASFRHTVNDKVVRLKNDYVFTLTDFGTVGPDEEDYIGTTEYLDKRWDVSWAGVVNGDIGQIEAIEYFKIKGKTRNYIVVNFRNPDRKCILPASEPEIALAYAITCHKAQGSGWPVVIVPVHDSFYWNHRTGNGLWSRELIYTMFSRAEQILITVGKYDAIPKAIGRKTIHKRKTLLSHFIRENFKDVGTHP